MRINQLKSDVMVKYVLNRIDNVPVFVFYLSFRKLNHVVLKLYAVYFHQIPRLTSCRLHAKQN